MIFIGSYDLYESKVKRYYVTSAVNKIKYMLSAFEQVYGDFVVYSACRNIERKFKIFPKEVIHDGGISIIFPFSWGGSTPFHGYLQRQWIPICIFFYLLFHARKNEHVIVYHSVGYKNSILWAKKLKKFKLILDVEEIYSDVQSIQNKIIRNEYNHFKAADAYIFSTEMLNERINLKNKPYTVINGTYNVEKIISDKFDDGKVHVVYAGTFDVRKGGTIAVEAAEYLNENYVLHICGFGNHADTNYLLSLVNKINKKSKCKIIYHGLLQGNDYLSLIQKCHIGLSPQDPSAAFNATSFPSKILSYLSNGLAVVSIRIPAIEGSQVGNCIFYYDKQTPESIVQAIKSVDIKKNYRQVISELADNFVKNMITLKQCL